MPIDEDVIAWRRHLHRNPEVSFSEHGTSAWIAERLEAFGLEVERPTETSVLARLRTGRPGASPATGPARGRITSASSCRWPTCACAWPWPVAGWRGHGR